MVEKKRKYPSETGELKTEGIKGYEEKETNSVKEEKD